MKNQMTFKGTSNNDSLSCIPVSMKDAEGGEGCPTPPLRRPFRLDNLDVSKSWDSADMKAVQTTRVPPLNKTFQ